MVLFCQTCHTCPVLPDQFCLSNSACTVLPPSYALPVLPVLFCLSYSACPLLPPLFWLFSSGCTLLTVPPGCLISTPVSAALFWKSRPSRPVLEVQSWQTSSACPALVVLSRLSSPSCPAGCYPFSPVLTAQFCLSCSCLFTSPFPILPARGSSCLALRVRYCLSCSACPVLLLFLAFVHFLFCPGCLIPAVMCVAVLSVKYPVLPVLSLLYIYSIRKSAKVQAQKIRSAKARR
jgi:hypothetical protein